MYYFETMIKSSNQRDIDHKNLKQSIGWAISVRKTISNTKKSRLKWTKKGHPVSGISLFRNRITIVPVLCIIAPNMSPAEISSNFYQC